MCIRDSLYDEGHTVELAENAAQARAARLRMRPDLVLRDIWMPDTDGVSLLKEWGSQGLLDMPVIMMSGHATIDTAVEATRIGAMDFLEKPITLQRLLKTVAAGLARGRVPHPAPVAAPATASATVALEDELDPPTLSTAPANEVPVTANGQLGSISLDQPLREARDEFERIYFCLLYTSLRPAAQAVSFHAMRYLGWADAVGRELVQRYPNVLFESLLRCV